MVQYVYILVDRKHQEESKGYCHHKGNACSRNRGTGEDCMCERIQYSTWSSEGKRRFEEARGATDITGKPTEITKLGQ